MTSNSLSQSIEDIADGKTMHEGLLRQAMMLCASREQKQAITNYVAGRYTVDDKRVLKELAADLKQIESGVAASA